MSLAHLVRPAAGEPAGALVLFHGRGTSEHDLYPLLDALDPERRLLGVTPRGPLILPPGGAHPTQVIDRHYFKSIYFREPSGVLFELATPSPGFTIDEPLETLGEKLSIPPRLEELRDQIEATVRPLENPRTAARTHSG